MSDTRKYSRSPRLCTSPDSRPGSTGRGRKLVVSEILPVTWQVIIPQAEAERPPHRHYIPCVGFAVGPEDPEILADGLHLDRL